jgi:hypothetical protein
VGRLGEIWQMAGTKAGQYDIPPSAGINRQSSIVNHQS